MSHTVSKLDATRDALRLQRLLERCSDYYELHEGWPTPADAGEYELTLLPSTAAAEDLIVLALEEEGVLDAMIQLYRNLPEQGTWWIGLLVVAPELRSRGLGARLLQEAFAAAAADGATTMKLAVSTANPRGQRFWEAAGFQDMDKTFTVTARSGHVDTGRIMDRPIASSGPTIPLPRG